MEDEPTLRDALIRLTSQALFNLADQLEVVGDDSRHDEAISHMVTALRGHAATLNDLPPF